MLSMCVICRWPLAMSDCQIAEKLMSVVAADSLLSTCMCMMADSVLPLGRFCQGCFSDLEQQLYIQLSIVTRLFNSHLQPQLS